MPSAGSRLRKCRDSKAASRCSRRHSIFINFHVYHISGNSRALSFGRQSLCRYQLCVESDVQPRPDHLRCAVRVGYLISEFSEDQIRSIAEYYSRTFSGDGDDPSASYEFYSPLSSEERQRLLVEWNDTRSDYADEACIHQLFEAQVERTPEKVAINFEEHNLTYGN